MRRYWYRRILIMILIFTITIGASYYFIETRENFMNQQVSAATSDKTMVIPGGMPVGIYLETDGVMVLGTDEVESIDGTICEPAKHLVKAGDYIQKIDDKIIRSERKSIC